MTFKMVITLLKEFNYERNGKEATIEFLKEMVRQLEDE